ncbi:MAG: DUF4097 family beta strand repeat-containing protein [Candidatus Korobacteraceae bacterium]
MASTYTPPPMAPTPPPPRYQRSLAGPIVLIVIGGVFLLHNFGIRLPIWHFFGHWWPLLLILWGVIKLIEHANANRQGYRASGIGAGSVLLLILIIIFGLGAHYSSDVNWGGVRDQIQIDDDLGGMFGNAFTYDDTLEQSFPSDGNLRIVSDRGAITVQPSDSDNIKVVVHKKLYANNQNDADKYNQGSKPVITVNGNSVLLNANTNGAGDHGVSADMDVYVPRKAALDIASRRGDLNITERTGDVKISGQRGDVTLNDIDGAVKINLEKGSVKVSKVVGDVDIDGRIDDANVDDVTGSVRLNGDYFDSIHLSKVTKIVTFKSSHSDLTLASVPGDLDISGDSLRGTDVTGPSRLVMRSKEVHLEGVSGDLDLESTNGDIEVRAAQKLPVGKMTITGRKGDITLVLPANAGFQIDATARSGDINTDFSNIKVDKEAGARSQATGTVGNGAAHLVINSDRGDINISKG